MAEKILKHIKKIPLHIGLMMCYILGTVEMFCAGLLIPDIIEGRHLGSSEGTAIGLILGYLYIFLLCPKKYKVWVATSCAAFIGCISIVEYVAIDRYYEMNHPNYEENFYTAMVPLVLGYLLILLTCRIETVVYRRSANKERIGMIIGLASLAVLAIWILICNIFIS